MNPFIWASIAAKSPTLSPYTKLIIFYLSTYMERYGDEVSPSLSCVCVDLGISKDRLLKSLSEASQQGWILVQHRKGDDGKAFASNLYRAELPDALQNSPLDESKGTFYDSGTR